MRSEAGCLVILIELSIPLNSPFASRLSSSMLAFRPLSLQSAVDNGRTGDPFFHGQRRALRSESSAADVVDGGLSARAIPIRPSTHGKALSGSIQGQGCVPFASRNSRSATVRSARCKPARNTQGVSPTRSVALSALPSASRHPWPRSAYSQRGPAPWPASAGRCLSRRRSFGLNAAIAHSVSGDL